jgi:opacity protein-like surface antigen
MKSSILLAGLALATLAPATLAQSAKVCFEAESATKIESPIKKIGGQTKTKVSGGGYLEIPWDKNATKGLGQATYTFNAKTAGTYTVWARALWQNGCGNSVTVSVNGGPDKILGEDGLYEEWHWVGGRARVKLNAGKNTMVLKNRETGVQVDQFFFGQDSEYTPTNIRPITK